MQGMHNFYYAVCDVYLCMKHIEMRMHPPPPYSSLEDKGRSCD